MTCHDFERGWNELLDAGARAGSSEKAIRYPPKPAEDVTELELSLRQHAAACPACGQLAARYERLQRAIDAWHRPPAAPADLADRILGIAQRPSSGRWPNDVRHARPLWRIGLPLATAAAAAVALVVVRPIVDGRRSVRPTTKGARAFAKGSRGNGPLETALSNVSVATWELARSASEPAARISRQVLDVATNSNPADSARGTPLDEGSGSFLVSVSSYVPDAPDPASASALLREVGDRLATGVIPLSTTARHAFGFLLESSRIKPVTRVTPRNAKGA